MDMDIPERLNAVRRREIGSVKWIHAQDFLRAIRAPADKRITARIPSGQKTIISSQRGSRWYERVRELYIAPEAAREIAIDYADYPNAEIRAWIDDGRQ